MDMTVKIGGVTLESPVIVSSCDDGRDGERIKKVAGFKPGAVTTKTIVMMDDPPKDPRPCIKKVKGGLINCVLGTVVPAKRWFEHDFKAALQGGVPVIANMAGLTPDDCVKLAIECEKAGASMIEYPAACPHMGGILEAMYPGLKMPVPEVHDPTFYAECIKAIKKEISIPLIAKLSSIQHLNVKEWAIAVEEAGADAIAAADTIGPVMAIDIETGMPLLGGPRGYGGLSGSALKPLVMRMVLEIAETVKIPVIGMGGVSTGIDAVEFIMAGASMVEVATEGILSGPDAYRKIHDGIAEFMKRKGYESPNDFRGLTLQRIRERKENNKQIINNVVVPKAIEGLCSGCGVCSRSCVYEAIKIENGTAVFDSNACYGCGLCSSVCHRKAIVQNYY